MSLIELIDLAIEKVIILILVFTFLSFITEKVSYTFLSELFHKNECWQFCYNILFVFNS